MSISEEYKEQLQLHHAANPSWGSEGSKFCDEILAHLHGNTILDYGCGKGKLKAGMRSSGPSVEVYEYDPGIPGKDILPEGTFDLVVSRDVLEHVEPEYIDDVLSEIESKTEDGIWFMIHTRKAGAILPDGRNAHLIQEGLEWWTEKLEPYFPGHEIEWTSNGVWLRVTWRRSNYASTKNTPVSKSD